MQHLMRKYKRQLLIVGAILIVPTFILWGSWSTPPGNPDAAITNVIVSVGDVPITEAEFRDALNDEVNRRRQQGEEVEWEQLDDDGTALNVLDSLIQRALLTHAARQIKTGFTDEFLQERLRAMDMFKNAEGVFDPKAFNTWVEQNSSTVNWAALYENIANQTRHELAYERAVAPARVTESELKEQFEEANTKFKINYVLIDPAVEPTEEQMLAHYNANQDRYKTPEERKARFVSLSLRADKPPVVDEILTRARNGEDFAELAKQYSEGFEKEEGGDLGWKSQSFAMPEHERALFELEAGAVSDAIDGPLGYYIFKVEEKRANEITNEPEVKARQIVIKAELPAEEKTKREALAAQIQAKAAETNFEQAAQEAGLEIRETSFFNANSASIENVLPQDARDFRMGLSTLADQAVSEVITAPRNLYVAQVSEVKAPAVQPLEEVREQVRENSIAELKREPEYLKNLVDLATRIATEAESLQAIQTNFPELQAKTETMPEFSISDFRFGEGPFWNLRALIHELEHAEPGSMVGPVQDLMGQTYFVELESKTAPDETVWTEKWPEQEEQLKTAALAQRQQEVLEDYLMYLRAQVNPGVNQELFNQLFTPRTPAEGAPAAEDQTDPNAPAEAPLPEAAAPAPAPIEATTPPAPETAAADAPATPEPPVTPATQ